MKPSPLGPGKRAVDRGSTFATERKAIARRANTGRRGPVSPASKAQREKVRLEPCVVSGQEAIQGAIIDPAHLAARAHGGCDDPLCTVPLRRDLHRQFDEGEFDLLPFLVVRRVPEIQHALGHYDGDLIALLQRLTGRRWTEAA